MYETSRSLVVSQLWERSILRDILLNEGFDAVVRPNVMESLKLLDGIDVLIADAEVPNVKELYR